MWADERMKCSSGPSRFEVTGLPSSGYTHLPTGCLRSVPGEFRGNRHWSAGFHVVEYEVRFNDTWLGENCKTQLMVKIMKWDSPASNIFVESNHHQPLPVQSSVMAIICYWFSMFLRREMLRKGINKELCKIFQMNPEVQNTTLLRMTRNQFGLQILRVISSKSDWRNNWGWHNSAPTFSVCGHQRALDGRCPRQNQQKGLVVEPPLWKTHAPVSTIPVRPKCKWENTKVPIKPPTSYYD